MALDHGDMRTTTRYILDGREPVPCEDLFEWARWMDQDDVRRVAETIVADVCVSTVFLGLDHGGFYGSPPVLFETMIFGGDFDQKQLRYTTWQDAEEGHAEMVAKVQSAIDRKGSMNWEEWRDEVARLLDAQRKRRE